MNGEFEKEFSVYMTDLLSKLGLLKNELHPESKKLCLTWLVGFACD